MQNLQNNYIYDNEDLPKINNNYKNKCIVHCLYDYNKALEICFIKTTNDGSGLFRTQFIGATIGNNLTVQDTVISIENSFVRDISNWTQRASLNRITLFLEVQVSREYIKPPPEGLIINYSGTCSPTNKKI